MIAVPLHELRRLVSLAAEGCAPLGHSRLPLQTSPAAPRVPPVF
jgi:hypothetical protein